MSAADTDAAAADATEALKSAAAELAAANEKLAEAEAAETSARTETDIAALTEAVAVAEANLNDAEKALKSAKAGYGDDIPGKAAIKAATKQATAGVKQAKENLAAAKQELADAEIKMSDLAGITAQAELDVGDAEAKLTVAEQDKAKAEAAADAVRERDIDSETDDLARAEKRVKAAEAKLDAACAELNALRDAQETARLQRASRARARGDERVGVRATVTRTGYEQAMVKGRQYLVTPQQAKYLVERNFAEYTAAPLPG